jgi:hypothetical protein
MSLAMINSGRLWADQVSALSAQRAAAPNALTAPGSSPLGATTVGGGGGLFAGLLSSLTGNAAAPGTSSSSTASRAQIAQDLQAFTQSLLQALAANQYAPPPSGSSAMTLNSLLQGMLQHVQQQGSWAASGGHVVHLTA